MAMRMQPCTMQQHATPCRGNPCNPSSLGPHGKLSSAFRQQHQCRGRRQADRRRQICTASSGSSGSGATNDANNMINLLISAARKTLSNLSSKQKDPQQAPEATAEALEAVEAPSHRQQGTASFQPNPEFAVPSLTAQRQHQEQDMEPPPENSLESWREYIERMDHMARQCIEIDDALERAVLEERFGDAAELRAAIDDLHEEDVVGLALEAMDNAVDEQDYKEAARLRDEYHLGISGWWAGRGENDPYGHLLHIAPGFSNFTGRAFLPRQLHELKEYVSSGQVDEEDMDTVLLSMGQPLMEIFLRKMSDGRTSHCATAVLPTDAVQVQLDTNSDQDVDEHSIDAVLEDLKTSLVQQLQEQIQADPEAYGADPTASISISGDSIVFQNAGDMSELPNDPFGLGLPMDDSNGGTLVAEVTASVNAVRLSRGAADLRFFGRDRFAIQAVKRQEEEGQQEAAQPQDDDINVAEMIDQLESTVNVADAIGADPTQVQVIQLDKPFNGQQESASQYQVINGDLQSEERKPFEMKVFNRVQQELSRLRRKHNMGEGPAITREIMEQVVDRVRKEMAAQKEADMLAKTSNPTASSVTQTSNADVDSKALYEGRITYTRIPPEVVRTDPFTGTHLAAFGPHGMEMLLLNRTRAANGHEIVTARKLTGDPNVPAGQISFTARIDKAARLSASEYPDYLGVVARYPGKGLIANPGFEGPRWVEGELLQFSPASYVTQGASLGFVWAVPGQRRYLVLLQHVGLENGDV